LGLGFAGVDLFFVLSGFLLSLPFAEASLNGRPAPSKKRYFARRLLRVFPAYYAQLLIILIVGAWFVTWRPLEGASLLAHLVMFLTWALNLSGRWLVCGGHCLSNYRFISCCH